MTQSSAMPPRGWRFGMHPSATGMQVRSLARVELPIGEALRLEMVAADQSAGDDAHVQYYICTESGGWALWLSGSQAEVAAREAALHELVPAKRRHAVADASSGSVVIRAVLGFKGSGVRIRSAPTADLSVGKPSRRFRSGCCFAAKGAATAFRSGAARITETEPADHRSPVDEHRNGESRHRIITPVSQRSSLR